MKKITVKVSDDDFQSFTGDAIGFSTDKDEVSIYQTFEDAGFGTRRTIGHFTSHVWVREIQPVIETRDEKKKFIKAVADEKPEIIDKFTQQEISGRDPNERPDFGILTAKVSTDRACFNDIEEHLRENIMNNPDEIFSTQIKEEWVKNQMRQDDMALVSDNRNIELSTGLFPIEIPADAEDNSEPLSPEEKEASFKELKKKYSSGKVKS